ncbi:MAG: hypothetical protein GY952_20975 [Rhodobacteraceae bacterium]|nr:hypothetical protein [Paracoccaceae bacterium]
MEVEEVSQFLNAVNDVLEEPDLTKPDSAEPSSFDEMPQDMQADEPVISAAPEPQLAMEAELEKFAAPEPQPAEFATADAQECRDKDPLGLEEEHLNSSNESEYQRFEDDIMNFLRKEDLDWGPSDKEEMAEEEPTAAPEELVPAAVPAEAEAEAKPAAALDELVHTAAPEEAKPDAAPEELEPAAVPAEAEAKPAAALEELLHTAAPEEAKPDAAPEEIEPAAVPAEAKPDAAPAEQTPATPLVLRETEMLEMGEFIDPAFFEKAIADHATVKIARFNAAEELLQIEYLAEFDPHTGQPKVPVVSVENFQDGTGAFIALDGCVAAEVVGAQNLDPAEVVLVAE